jgi:N6-adenosine-specific RNA methylase IME4
MGEILPAKLPQDKNTEVCYGRIHGQLTPKGWLAPEQLSFEEWQETGEAINALSDATKWARGDWLAYGEGQVWGDKYEQAIDDSQLEYGTLAQEKYVSNKVEFCTRVQNLSWTHHRAVAPLDPPDQKRWLKEAEPLPGKKRARLTVEDLRDAIKAERDELQAGRLRELGEAAPFGVVYADPPWRYEHVKTNSRQIENHYETANLEEIKGHWREVNFADDCVLFLWATSPKLGEAFGVLAAWGFEYRTCMVWVKDRVGMGYYARQRHELLLIARRGLPPVPGEGVRPDSVVEAPRTEHSAKPERFYELIEAMYPEARKLEMYSRSPREGWEASGYEAAA